MKLCHYFPPRKNPLLPPTWKKSFRRPMLSTHRSADCSKTAAIFCSLLTRTRRRHSCEMPKRARPFHCETPRAVQARPASRASKTQLQRHWTEQRTPGNAWLQRQGVLQSCRNRKRVDNNYYRIIAIRNCVVEADFSLISASWGNCAMHVHCGNACVIYDRKPRSQAPYFKFVRPQC